MKKLLCLFALLNLSAAFAASLDNLNGQWVLDCTQTQINGVSGHVLESYTFNSSSYQFKREWFKKADCKGTAFKLDAEEGTIKLGKENTNNGFNPEGTFEIDYISSKGNDRGVIWLNDMGTKMRTARGLAENRNVMLGVFQYSKRQK
jgi:hypothetical protein